MSRHDKLRELADKIDHDKLWQRPAMDRDKLTDDQRARLDAGVMLRRYADILQPGRWLVIPPTGSVQFSAGSLDKAYEMARQDEVRCATRTAAQSSTDQPLTRCAAARDGDCTHAQCPQLRDGEPAKSGRHCPLDTSTDQQG